MSGEVIETVHHFPAEHSASKERNDAPSYSEDEKTSLENGKQMVEEEDYTPNV
jgi:hypothetical protein